MPENLRVVVGSDDAGSTYKRVILDDLKNDPRVSAVIDVGVNEAQRPGADYPEVAIAAGEAIVAGTADRAILFCGTGIGVAVSANKVPGIRATVAHDSYSVERSIMSNNCQVLTMGQRVIGEELARRLASEWLGYQFDPSSNSQRKVAAIVEYEDASATDGDHDDQHND